MAQNAIPGSDDAPVDDSLDEVLGAELKTPIFAVQRTKCRSDLLINFINYFGRLGGFEKMLEIVKSILNREEKVSFKDALPLLSTFCESIGKVAPVLFKPFAVKFIPQLIDDSKAAFFQSNAKMLRDTKKEFIDNFLE